MTPCEKLGYKVGDKFTVIKDSYFEKGTIVALSEDDGSEVPWFTRGGVRRALIIGSNPDVEPAPSKLKPAKQALADAIHQNGGWVDGAAAAIFGKKTMTCAFLMDWALPVSYNPERGSWSVISSGVISGFKMKPFVNWHQCILSRDEYFTAYPEQVNVEINNETEHKVEAEMKSESEMTIKVGDWHKNGELPPVGEVVEMNSVYWDKDRFEIVTILAKTCEYAIVAYKNSEQPCNVKDVSFRPLRTERDKAIDEMIDCLAGRWANCEEIAAHLYENGYRKEVK